jgi:superfamily II DNA/RNA helicase
VVLAGKDVCGSAVTGSGKTAAFCLPVLERLLFRPKKVAATRESDATRGAACPCTDTQCSRKTDLEVP